MKGENSMTEEKLAERIHYFLPLIGSVVLFIINRQIILPTTPIPAFDVMASFHYAILLIVELTSLWGAYLLAGIQVIGIVWSLLDCFKQKKAI